MCGACGRTTVPDPALGAVRTMRQHLIVAGAINSMCGGLPGAPKVVALKDGWMVSGPSGSSRPCGTVVELWVATIGCLTDGSTRRVLLGRQQAYSADPDNEGLPARTAGIGHGLTELACGASHAGGS